MTVMQLSGIHHALLFTSQSRGPNTNRVPKVFRSFLRLGHSVMFAHCSVIPVYKVTTTQLFLISPSTEAQSVRELLLHFTMKKTRVI